MSESASTENRAEAREKAPKRYFRAFVYCCGLLFVFAVFLNVIFGRSHGRAAYESFEMQAAREIGLSMFQYSTDHDGKYPDGKSSTEVFQKLIDGKYISDPTIFYIPLPGKTEPVFEQKLKSENVCWDVTCCLGPSDSDYLPVVFMTGYKVNYVPGGSAVAIILNPYPHYDRCWIDWWNGYEVARPGIAVCYKSNSAMFMELNLSKNPDGTIPNFVPPQFDPQGKTYRQLTPDGPLP